MYIFNGVVTEITSATMTIAYELKITTQDLIHWEMMLEDKRMSCHTFDLAGVDPNPAQGSKEEGIRRFKEKRGGRYWCERSPPTQLPQANPPNQPDGPGYDVPQSVGGS